ncbi:hypothetical protein Droror1_Dr00001010 [Drosera rotundifolia]
MKRDPMQATKNAITSVVSQPRRSKIMKSKKDDVPENKRSENKARKMERKKLELQCRCSPSHLHNMMVHVKKIVSNLCMSKLKQTPFFQFLDCPRILTRFIVDYVNIVYQLKYGFSLEHDGECRQQIDGHNCGVFVLMGSLVAQRVFLM